MKNYFAFLTFFFATVTVFGQAQDTTFHKLENAIAQQEMLFKNYDQKVAELKASYRVDLTDFEKEDLMDKVWYYELNREVAELKIKFLNKEVAYAKGELERPNFKVPTAIAAIENIPNQNRNQ